MNIAGPRFSGNRRAPRGDVLAFSVALGLAISLICTGVSFGGPVLVAQEVPSPVRFDAVLRPGYHGAWRSDRDGSSSDSHDARVRAQFGVRWSPTPAWEFRARFAGRFSTEQETLRFYLRDHVPATDGIRMGESTLDELYVAWRPTPRSRLQVGRMQTSYELAGVPRKSLHRNDSPNTDVTWTDGVHLSLPVGEGWRHHLIVQRNGRRGATNVVRGPLDMTGTGSRATVVASLQAEHDLGPLIQRAVDVTFMPGVVPRTEEEAGHGDYVAMVLRVAAEAPVAPLGGRPVVAAEGGLASGVPSRVLLGTGRPEDGRGDGWAFQISASLMEMGEGHSVGLVHSQAGDGWLVSPDIRDNNRELEARYYWQYAPWGRLDVRFRHREEMRIRPGSPGRRTDRDMYFRTTLRF